MFNEQSSHPHRWLSILVFIVVFASACAPIRIGTSWPSVSTIGDDQTLVVAFNTEIIQIDPTRGLAVELVDADGNPRLDEQGNPRPWRVDGNELEGANFFSAPIVVADGSSLLFASSTGFMYEFSLATARVADADGHDLLGGVIADVAMDDNYYYVSFISGGLAAVDRETFQQVWFFETAEGVWATPLLDEGVLYVGSMNHILYAIDAQTGAELWQVDLRGGVAATPLIYNNRLYVGSFARAIFEISIDGEILNEYATASWVWSTPVVYNDVLFFGDLSGAVYALDTTDDLAEVWRFETGTLGIRAQPVVTDTHVIVATRDGIVFWLDRITGEELFTRQVAGEILSNMVVISPTDTLNIDPMVVISTVNPGALLTAYRLDTGQSLWTYPSQ